MSIEKDIHQRKFQNEYQKGIVNFIYTYNWMNEKIKKFFDKEHVTAQQYNILRILRGAGKPISTLQIRQRMLDKMSDTSRIVDRLLAKGLVKKNISALDKRLVDIVITVKGKNLLTKMDKYEPEIDKILSNLTTTDIKKLNILFDKIRS